MTDLDSSDGEAGELGPAMLALNERQRKFVMLVVEQPKRNHTKAARQAGFLGNQNVMKVTGFRLSHDPKVLKALHEEMGKRVQLSGLIGLAGLIKMVEDPKHPQHFRACEALADRAGFAPKMTLDVSVDDKRPKTDAQKRTRIMELAAQLGVDVERLMGANAAPMLAGPVIKGEVIDGS